jgi:hypothetical protein
MCLLAGCGVSKDANRKNFQAAVSDYLDAHGDMCIGKVRWPIDITKPEADSHSANSIQLPVLQKVGLVSMTPLQGAAIPTMRFALTAEGEKFYLHKKMTSVASESAAQVHDGDLCYGKLHLDQVIGWEKPRDENGQLRTAVTYTYSINAAPWTKNPDVQRVFPVVAMVVKSGGVLQLKQVVALTKDGWKGQQAVE